MGETIRVEAEGFSLPYKNIDNDDFDPDEHVRYRESEKSSAVAYTYATNGRFTVYEGEDEVAAGAGKENLIGALKEIGSSLEAATDITD